MLTGETSPYFLAACFIDGFRCSVNLDEQRDIETRLRKQKQKDRSFLTGCAETAGHRNALSLSFRPK